MQLFNKLKSKLKNIKNWFFKSSKIVKILIVVVVLVVGFGATQVLGSSSNKPTYQTATATRGTLVESVNDSGNISSSDTVSITTQATGVVSQVYVKDGDQVTQGEKIADITLDQNGQQRQAAAYASYLSAVSSEKNSQDSQLSSDASMWSAQQSYLDAQNAQNFRNNNSINPSTHNSYTSLESQSIDSAVTESQKAFNAAQQKYLDSSASVNAAQASLTSSSLSYQQASSTITAPATGTIDNLNLSTGVAVTAANNSSTSITASQTVGNIVVGQQVLQASVNLSEIDATKVTAGQEVTLTLDAFPGKTFTGKVVAVDTNGVVSSGVTTYPATIALDSTTANIYLNMAVTATIITKIRDGVILVPSAAVQTISGHSSVRILKNGQIQNVSVTVGDSSDTQTEIDSGINVGDTVVTAVITPTTGTSGTTGTSPFSGTGLGGLRGGGGGGGGARTGSTTTGG